ncbi:conserved protein of unknown function (plasmid) [Cupriavidus taiwanensis]|uniref:Uncharacterized protein n=1 Tax=Cupriavidus taiwanensis TaxID=164546 RepID=A0A375FGH9_9BURK|nr:HEPN/Toprim-associated domain-containing protein [Cupriavidus taiwanensis]SOZ71243.1 conserved protein of unknown function [Cupriavidus taiwanensis]SOZ72300.1 conserved protein of unknown function [Cupriavidus taiwanensis]SOZ74589.1 conserved protein of unknown function [Cupriavidus taiwanensis]SPA03508.1 conserved protein of unknown function [Cupriavidus taiwanensis]SPA11406.1 conserved protein of unknown function [Cupriavidus taiwanensis]
MGSYAYLTVAGYPVYSTKNYLEKWMFRRADQRITKIPANKRNSLLWSVDPDDTSLEDQYEYVATAKTMKKRLDVAGFTLDASRKEFEEVCSMFAPMAHEWTDYTPDEATDIFLRKNINEWIDAIGDIIRDPRGLLGYKNQDLSDEPEIVGLLLRQPYYLAESEAFALDLGVPCKTFNCAMRIILEAVEDDEECAIDATALVEGGWIDSFALTASLGQTHTRFYDAFSISVSEAADILQLAPASQTLMRLIYSNLITALETYLSDTAKRYILPNKCLLRRFVETDKSFQRDRKFGLNELFQRLDAIESVAEEAIDRMVFHNLENIKSVYSDVFLVDLTQSSLDALAAAVTRRHDIVHRNGRSTKGASLVLDQSDITALYILVTNFVSQVDAQVRNTMLATSDDDFE